LLDWRALALLPACPSDGAGRAPRSPGISKPKLLTVSTEGVQSQKNINSRFRLNDDNSITGHHNLIFLVESKVHGGTVL
jgi:hypothetical protein